MPWFDEAPIILDGLPPAVMTIRRNDRLPAFACQVVAIETGVPLDLTNAACYMTLRSATPGVTAVVELQRLPLTIDDAVNGIVSYDWQLNETTAAKAAVYDVVIEVEFAVDTITVPSPDQTASIIIRPDVASDYFGRGPSGQFIPDDAGGYYSTATFLMFPSLLLFPTATLFPASP